MPHLWPRTRNVSQTEPARESHLMPMPIIVGSPRSGTTLLRFMLDSHSQLTIPPETAFLALAPKLRGRDEKLRKKFFAAVTTCPKPLSGWPDFEIPADVFRAALEEIKPFTVAEGFRTFYRLYAALQGKPRWGDKTPLYCRELETIRRVLPEARFIHIIRDGRDAALSLRNMWFSPGSRIETQAAYWRTNILSARRAGAGHADYLEVRYEDLILRTRETLEQICAFIRLDFEDAMMTYYERTPERLKEHKGRLKTDGTVALTQEQRLLQQKRTTEPPDSSCIFAWKHSMSTTERAQFEKVAGDLLKDLGYEV